MTLTCVVVKSLDRSFFTHIILWSALYNNARVKHIMLLQSLPTYCLCSYKHIGWFCHVGRLSLLHLQMLWWGHDSRLACYPGAIRTTALIAQRYLWPLLKEDIKWYLAACRSAPATSPAQAPAGLLRPLPVPSQYLFPTQSINFLRRSCIDQDD